VHGDSDRRMGGPQQQRSELVKTHRFPGFMRLFGVAVQICALFFSIPPAAVGQTYDGSCWTSTPTQWPVATWCDCTSGSGSCYTSKQRQFFTASPGYECTRTGQGSHSCDPGPLTTVGVEYDCGNKGYNTWNVMLCATYGLAMTGTTIAAILATGGLASLAAIVAEATTGGMTIYACRWCEIHYCGVVNVSQRREIQWHLNPSLSQIPCPPTGP
jgi:hypothetical protein